MEHYDYTIIFNDYMLVILHIEIIESISIFRHIFLFTIKSCTNSYTKDIFSLEDIAVKNLIRVYGIQVLAMYFYKLSSDAFRDQEKLTEIAWFRFIAPFVAKL